MVVLMPDGSVMDEKILSVRDLSVVSPSEQASDEGHDVSKILNNVSIDVPRGQAVGITGRSGAGKSTLLRSIMGLIDSKYTTSGWVSFDDVDLVQNGQVDRVVTASLRGSSMAFVWQNPKDMLHPLHKTGRQITEHLRVHENLTKAQAATRGEQALRQAGVQNPLDLLRKYPHELSGGEAQRVCLAQALVTRPRLLIADEILSSLDPVTSSQVVETLKKLVRDGLSILFVSHDLDVISELCESTAVMYNGQIVEHGPTAELFNSPEHPHTQELVDANLRIRQ